MWPTNTLHNGSAIYSEISEIMQNTLDSAYFFVHDDYSVHPVRQLLGH